MEAIDNNSGDYKRLGKTIGQGLLYTDWKCFENSSATSLGLIIYLLSTSSGIEFEVAILR
jgi:hypothetical protein